MCGAPAPPPFAAPPPEGAPDLDLRPGEPTRSTLRRWVQTCRSCGASAPDLAMVPRRLRPVVEGEAYAALAGGSERPFLRWALLAAEGGERDEGAGALLQAAWVLDDAGDDPGAAGLRRLAAAAWGQGGTVQDGLRVLDAWRRAGEMEAARAQLDRLGARPGLEETDRAVLRFQDGLIAAGDTGRHLLSSALRPPARTPHVTHGRAAPARVPARAGAKDGAKDGEGAARPFWRRLLGG